MVPGHEPTISRSAARSCPTSSAAHATPTAVAIGSKSGLASATTPATAVTPIAVSATTARTTAAAAAPARAIFGDADPERTAFEVLAIELGDRLLSSGVVLHLHERKAARPTGLAIRDHRHRHD